MTRSAAAPIRPPCRLYLVTPPVIADLDDFAEALALALSAGDVAALQVRLKSHDGVVAGPGQVRRALDVLGPIARSHGTAVILNDDPELARAAGCDGVHLGQGDMALAQARRILGPDAMIGVTCHDSRHLAMEAAEGGADYVAFGAFFATGTKATQHRPDPDILTVWQETMEVPCVAIGGITVDNAGGLARAGADFVAVSAGVWAHPEGATAAVRAFDRVLADAFDGEQSV